MKNTLEERNIPYTRVEGVYGAKLSEPISDFNERKFNIFHGKAMNKAEIGCYLSHMKVFRTFLQSNNPYALVLEDDVVLPENMVDLLEAALPYEKHWDMIRLTSLKQGKYIPFAPLPDGHNLSYNLKQLKSTGAYLVNRHAAQCCLDKMLPMFIPYDVALDREWHYGFKTACISPMPIPIDFDIPGQIGSAGKIKFYRATTFRIFHALTRCELWVYRTLRILKARHQLRTHNQTGS
jgi:glycosyl transferase family 25